MIVNFPAPPEKAGASYLVQLIAIIRQAFLPVVSTREAVPRVILRDVDGVSWDVTVSTAGALVVTKNDGKSGL